MLCDVVLQEEISHCAAGVQWLNYLHQSAGNVQREEQEAGNSGQLIAASATVDEAVDGEQQDQPEAVCSPGVQKAGAERNTAAAAAAALGAATGPSSCCAGVSVPVDDADNMHQGIDGASSYDWRQDAQQHATVEDWFHSLVRGHFKGSLKVRLHVSRMYCACLL